MRTNAPHNKVWHLTTDHDLVLTRWGYSGGPRAVAVSVMHNSVQFDIGRRKYWWHICKRPNLTQPVGQPSPQAG